MAVDNEGEGKLPEAKGSEAKTSRSRASRAKPVPADPFDVERLRELVELMESHELSELDLRRDELRIRLRRGGVVSGGIALPAPTPVALPAVAPSTPVTPATAPVDNSKIVTINSPMVGTFYARPNPDAEPFVKVGDHVGPEKVVCIIEAMKVFNEIQAEVAGQIVAVLVDPEESVDFGKPLFRVDTSK